MDFWLWVGELITGVGAVIFAVLWVMDRREHRRAARDQQARDRALADRLQRAERLPRERSTAHRRNGSL